MPRNDGVRWDEFFMLGDPVERRALRIASRNLDREESLSIRRGGEPARTVVARPTHGTQLRDFLWPSSIVPVVVRERVVDLLTSEGLTGWRTYDVEVFDRDGIRLPEFVGFQVTGHVGAVPDPPVDGGPAYFDFDVETWDGSDFFRPEDSGTWFISPRAERALRAANVRNVSVRPIADVERPYLLREPHLFLRLVMRAGADVAPALETLRETLAGLDGLHPVAVADRVRHADGPKREAVIVHIVGDREPVIEAYDRLRRITADGWADAGNGERDTSWELARTGKPFLTGVVSARLAAFDEGAGHPLR